MCLFSSCSFCGNDVSEPLHHVSSDKMGENLLEIKLKTQDHQVRICVSDLEDAGDASALEKYYHRNCLRSAQRTFVQAEKNNAQSILSLCGEQLIMYFQNTHFFSLKWNIFSVYSFSYSHKGSIDSRY